ncbi:hypothetical protein [Pseudoalteromonas sp. TB64]|uniref:DUF6998 domain-containing protein n=1 Tax=Pseudoalteromonas sp. TB64 TaxID=1938600 RepID=UPI00041391DF|nr:hypothetical protein [Pseudoalteromonas sp. TB64]
MSFSEFINDEYKYINWIQSNPNGFVINTSKSKRLDYRVLHTADCSYVTTLQGNAQEDGFTERGYIKICSTNVESLRDWTKQEGEKNGLFTQECARCKPWEHNSYSKGIAQFDDLLTLSNIKELYEKYLALVRFEVQKLGVKPTEVRHLIGRLGEFYCALIIDGSISHVVNQHGFDVLSKTGRRISVKTTSQKTGFVAISANTLEKVDDLMILQYKNDGLHEVYFGDINKAVSAARFYANINKYELDISKAKKLL